MHTHTPEPWIQGRPPHEAEDIFAHFEGPRGKVRLEKMATAFYWSGSENCGEVSANARRIVACVNACKDISVDALEQGAVQELVAAAKGAKNSLDTLLFTPLSGAVADKAIGIAQRDRERLIVALAKLQPQQRFAEAVAKLPKTK